MRCGDASVELGLREGGARRLALAPMIVGVEFDDRRRPQRPGRGRRGWSRRRRPLPARPAGSGRPAQALRAVGAAGDDRLGRDEQARAGDDALVDRLLEADVGEARALGAEIALGGEAGIERALGVDDRAGGAERERLVKHLIVPQRLIVGVQEEVRVALDHARASASCRGAGRLARPRSSRSVRLPQCGPRRSAPTILHGAADRPRRRLERV